MAKELSKRQINIPVDDIPRQFYNITADFPDPMPAPKDPESGPSRLANLGKIFTSACLGHEMAQERFIDIPDEVLELFIKSGRPRPLFRAYELEKELGTPAKLYYKSEFYSPTGSHKVNTAIVQAYFAKQEGFTTMTTETGAGQWGTALAYACSLVGLKCKVFWVRAAYNWKPDRLAMMKLLGAEVHASPSPQTDAGREIYLKDPEHPGSLAIAISEGIETALKDEKAVYSLGSVLNHVLLHQTIIGLETKKQLALIGEYPDTIISCLGGGSNFGGLSIPFFGDVLRGEAEKEIKFIAAQSQSAPNLQGEYKYDFGDYAETTPLLKMFSLGHKSKFPPIKGDGLRYHASAPIISYLRNKGMVDTIAYPVNEKEVFEAAAVFVRTEGFLPAPESAYSVKAAIDEALKCKKNREDKTILFNISGHGFLDLAGYKDVLKIA
ncbi:MAG: TrpB-like pyridoxal phosphate-dependent enzyme [Acidobacteria bacterium]|nr:TrpB-like pyridoxal phosphate-dependent enzyme [Acidobacteriota bacterium]